MLKTCSCESTNRENVEIMFGLSGNTSEEVSLEVDLCENQSLPSLVAAKSCPVQDRFHNHNIRILCPKYFSLLPMLSFSYKVHQLSIREGIKKNRFFLGKSPKL